MRVCGSRERRYDERAGDRKKKTRTVDCELRGAREILFRLGNVSRRSCYRTHARSIRARARLHACNKVNIYIYIYISGK